MEMKILCLQIEEWNKKSKRGDVCGIFGCEDKPTTYCYHCGNWYCDVHNFVLQLPGHSVSIPA